MSASTTDPGARTRRIRPFRRIRKAFKTWRHTVGMRLGLVPGPAMRGYMICSTGRSGSTYLMYLLTSTNCLGKPAEYFNTPYWRTIDPKYPKDPRAQFNIIRSAGATRNGIYAVKAHAFQVVQLGEGVDPFNELPNLKLVRLLRGDMIGRAVSLSRARQSRQFSTQSSRVTEPVYSEQSIRTCLIFLQEQESVWDEILGGLGREFITLRYEEILRDPQRAVDQVAMFMGVAPAPIDLAAIPVAVQRDASSRAWRERFLAETGNEFRHLAD